MPFTPLTFTQLIEAMVSQYSAEAATPANTNIGSALGAIFNAVALLGLNVQNEEIYVEDVSRMLSSSGTDLDSWGAQFNIPRVGAAFSSGTEIFILGSPQVGNTIIPVGGIIQTPGGLQFQVVVPFGPNDPNYGNFNSLDNGYLIPSGDLSGTASVQCLTSGTLGNVAANTIVQPGSTGVSPPIPNFATITNLAGFNNGYPAEADTAYQLRMQQKLSTGVVATSNAIAAAVNSVQAGLTYSIADGISPANLTTNGVFTVVVNVANQDGPPSGALIAQVATAVNAVRSVGITAFVVAPTLLTVGVSASIRIAAGQNVSAVLAGATAAVQTYLNSIGLDPAGNPGVAEVAEIYVILRTYPGVTNVSNVLLNGVGADVTSPNFYTQLVSGGVSLTSY